ncbi:MAG: N-methyl-L-tryptophan oxidase [Kutzneria sp.]|nr:N-methyl-L-tryptophan oxidase [Kutzneria sp.]
MRLDADVAVIGLGAWGASALWRLALRGVDVLGFERYGLGNALGSSHGGSRMFRITCLEHPGLVPMARRSLELWRELEAAAGTTLFEPCGGLLIGSPRGRIVGGTLRAAERHGIDVQTLPRDALRERFPQHAAVADDQIGVWEPSAGVLRPETAIRAAVRLAADAGATVFTDTRVTELVRVGSGVLLRTPVREFRVRTTVVTVGCWLPGLVAGLPLTTVRMPITWFRPTSASEQFGIDRFPVFMRELDQHRVLWGNGSFDGQAVKLGLEGAVDSARPMDPDDTDRSTVSDDWTELADLLATHLPGFGMSPARSAACMYSATPDGQFVLGCPGDPRLVVASGCNAHGFKHATGVGEVLADMVTGSRPGYPLGFTDPGRFT